MDCVWDAKNRKICPREVYYTPLQLGETNLRKWIITPEQRCDLEMLMCQGFDPLQGFLEEADYESVLDNMRLQNGRIWPMPITLDVNEDFASCVSLNETIELCDPDNTLIAFLHVKNKWKPNKRREAQCIFETEDPFHPGVHYLFYKKNDWYLGGTVTKVKDIKHYDFLELRKTPDALKKLFQEKHAERIVGFQTRNPMHRAHLELTLRAAKEIEGHILLHPVVGITKSGDIDYFTRVQCYQKILAYYPIGNVTLSLLPLAMRMAGPREALWHALIRKNYGCTHFIIGRDHAGPGNNAHGKAFYDPYAAQKLVACFQDEIGITMLPFSEMVYVKERKFYCPMPEVQSNETPLTISGTELRTRLQMEKPIPQWFSYPDIIEELRIAYLPKHKKGFTIFFTGLSGSGKSVLSLALLTKLKSFGIRNATILDSDITRRILSNELGFSKTDRDLNIRRIGFVASEITKTGGIAIVAAIAPYHDARHYNRLLISQYGGYIEVYLSTSFEECARRDTKGLYAKAIYGKLDKFTGYNDPYEPPENPEVVIDTSVFSVEESVNQITDFLINTGFVKFRKKPVFAKKAQRTTENFSITYE